MLGHKLVQVLRQDNDVWAFVRASRATNLPRSIFPQDRIEVVDNILFGDDLAEALQKIKPNLIINAAGIIKQVPEANDVAGLIEVNAAFPHRLAAIGKNVDARVITIGTDCVFSGRKGNYKESDKPDAEDLYGRSKLLGELTDQHCLTLRTSIIGRELNTRHSLVEWFLRNRGGSVQGYTKAIYSGMPTIVFANVVRQLITSHNNISGVYHVASSPISKFDLLNKLNAAYGAGASLEPTDEPVIDRSLDATLFTNATGIAIPDWDEMIRAMAADPTEYDTAHR